MELRNPPLPSTSPLPSAIPPVQHFFPSSTPNFHPSSGSTINSASMSSASLPAFWPIRPREYFDFAEQFFQINGIADEQQRYCHLVSAIGNQPQTIAKVSDVLRHRQETNSYSQLKNALLNRYSSVCSDWTTQLLQNTKRGTMSCKDFLFQLRSTLGDLYIPRSVTQTDLLRYCLLNSLDKTTRLFLYQYEMGPLDDLACHADEFLHRQKSSDAFPETTTSPEENSRQRLMNEVMRSRLDELERRVFNQSESRLFRKETSTQPSNDRFHNFSQGSARAPTARRERSDLCRYHSRYGSRAFRCEGQPCGMFHLMQSNGSGNFQADSMALGSGATGRN